MTPPTRILIVAGELSGDRYAARLATELRSKHPTVTICGIGGSYLAGVADTMVYYTDNQHAMGFWEQFQQRKRQSMLLTTLATYLAHEPVDHAIIIDFQHMNTKIAAILNRRGIPITTFITPSFWIWGDQKGIKRIAGYSRTIVTIFKKEYDLYRACHQRTYYFGHPVMQTYTPVVRADNVASIRPAAVLLYPGSRIQEVHYHFPAMLKAVQLLQKEDATLMVFVVSMSPSLNMVIQQYLEIYPVAHLTVTSSFSDRVLATSTFAISVAGTATLDLMLNRIPMISLGKVSYLTYLIGTYIFKIKLKYAALPNIIADLPIVPDLLLKDVRYEVVYREAKALLTPHIAHEMVRRYDAVIAQLITSYDPFEETAELVLSTSVS